MTPSDKEKTPWEKTIEKRTKNIGFLTRVDGLREWTKEENTIALYKEIKTWQETKGTKTFSISGEYSTPLGHGTNLKGTGDSSMSYNGMLRAVDAYQKTPMDQVGVLKEMGIHVENYEKRTIKKILKKAIDGFNLWDVFWFIGTIVLFSAMFKILIKGLK